MNESSADNEPGDTDSPSPFSDEFGILCRVCRTRMYARPDQIGQTIECPDCLTDHKITKSDRDAFQASRYRGPKPATRVESGIAAGASDALDEYQLAPIEDATNEPAPDLAVTQTGPEPATLRAPCPTCNWWYVGKQSDEGNLATCLDCGTVFTIKGRQAAIPKQRVVAQDPGIKIEPASDRPAEVDHSERLMAKAHEHRKKIDAQKPKPFKRPFSTGVYTYPWMPHVLQGWIALPILFCTGYAMCGQGLAMQGRATIVGMLAFLAGAPLIIFCIFHAGFVMVTFMTTTANGYHQPEYWPRFDFGERVSCVAIFVLSFCVAITPGGLISSQLPMPWKWTFWMISLLALHPFVFLSMLDGNSPVIPYTSHVHRTIQKAPQAWTRFYTAVAPVAIIAYAIPLVAILCRETTYAFLSVVVAVSVFTIGMTIYFGLLGRLGWVLSDVPTLEDENQANAPQSD